MDSIIIHLYAALTYHTYPPTARLVRVYIFFYAPYRYWQRAYSIH